MSAGKAMSRVEGPLKVTGRALYAADNNPMGLLHGVFLGAPYPSGRITAIDASAALRLPDVVRVLTRADMPKFGQVSPPAAVLRLPMQTDMVEHEGEAVAIVLADTLEAAEAGARLVEVSMERQAHVRPGAGKIEPAPEGGPLGGSLRKGDLDAGLVKAAHRVEQSYTQPGRHHNPMETSATVAEWQGNGCIMRDSVQHAPSVAIVLSAALGVKPEDVRVLAPHTGGAFGGKGYVWPHQILTAAAARIVGRPVKISLTRAQMYSMVTYQGMISQDMALGCDAEGRLTALRHEVTTVTPMTDTFSEPSTEISKNLYPSPVSAAA